MQNLLPFEKIERKVLVKNESETNKDYGKSPSERSVEELIKYGVININKPQGPTSHLVSDYVKKILKISKCGHSGSLDPNVTGCLPIALEDATRIVHYLLKSGKEYVCLMHLHADINQSKIHKVMQSTIGKMKQLPPIKSAVKRQLREREIYYIEILEIDGKDVLFKIGSEAGFYVRKYCHDLGKLLGTNAHMQQLVRTKAGPFTDKDWHSLQDLTDAYEYYKQGNEKEIKKIILPFELAASHLPKIWVMDSTVDSLCHGAQLSIPGISKLHSNIKKDDVVAIMTLKEEIICIGTAMLSSEEIIEQEKGLAIKNNAVFMKRKTYPKHEHNTSK